MATQPNQKAAQPAASSTVTPAATQNLQVGAKKFGTPPTPAEVAATVAANGGTISSAIRNLFAQGKSRSEIAHLLQKRYQHVRNVLITPVKQPSTATATQPVQAATATK